MTQLFAVIGLTVTTIPLILGVAILGIFWRTWWLYPAWAWFAVPIGAPAISFWHFAGLITFVSMLTAHTDNYKETRQIDWTKVVISWLAPIITWALLWLMAGWK